VSLKQAIDVVRVEFVRNLVHGYKDELSNFRIPTKIDLPICFTPPESPPNHSNHAAIPVTTYRDVRVSLLLDARGNALGSWVA